MKKRSLLVWSPLSLFIIIAAIFSFAPAAASADNVTVIHATVNVRYQGSLVWSGSVALTQGSTANITDDTGAVQSVASDSALEALAAADAASPDFSLSNLKYYSDYGSFYVACLDIAAVSAHACNNWQYVVDSAYPPEGAEKYILSDNDTLYFYFGSPRRIVLSAATVTASSTVSVSTQTYDYTDDTWTPLANAQIGATQPNPNDPYSPLVIASATSDANGTAQLIIPAPGTYSVGLASDYYSPSETLTVTAQQPQTTAAAGNASNNVPTSRSGGSAAPAATSTNSETKSLDIAASAPKEVTVIFDTSLASFIQKYNDFSMAVPKTAPKKPAVVAKIEIAKSETASVVEAPGTTTKSWFSGILRFFGI